MTLSTCYDLAMSCFFCFQEELAEGLHLIDFEQLKIENQTYNEKIEERNEVGWVFVCCFCWSVRFAMRTTFLSSQSITMPQSQQACGVRILFLLSTADRFYNCLYKAKYISRKIYDGHMLHRSDVNISFRSNHV